MKICISYANRAFRPAQAANERTALRVGNFDKYIAYSPRDINVDFMRRNKHILKPKPGTSRGGAGHYLWKPYVIHKTLLTLEPEDFLFYCDAGCLFLRPIDLMTEAMRQRGLDLIHFYFPPSPWYSSLERERTKRDAFVLMDCDTPRYTDTLQRCAGFSLWRRTPLTEQFVEEWLHYGQDERIITSMPNQCGKPDYPEFKGSERDQSIFSLLAKKYDFPYFNTRPVVFRGKHPGATRNAERSKNALIRDPQPIILWNRYRMSLPSLRYLWRYDAAPKGLTAICLHQILWLLSYAYLFEALLERRFRDLIRQLRWRHPRIFGFLKIMWEAFKRLLHPAGRTLQFFIGRENMRRIKELYPIHRRFSREFLRRS